MRSLLAPALALSWLLGAGAAASAGEHPLGPQVWYTPNPNSADFQNLWTPTAPWQDAASKVDVLGINHTWLLTATDEQILAAVDFAKLHHMKLDLEVEAVTRANATCGYLEGYVWPTAFPTEMATLNRLNVHFDILDMDGPLWNGHYITEANNGCALTVPDLVANVASTLAPIIAQYPSIQIYEIEPVPVLASLPDWHDSLTVFEDGLARVLGRPVRGLMLDVSWETPAWIQPLTDLRRFTSERNMRLGWYLDSSSFVYSDAQWFNSAATNIEYIEGTLGITPDIIHVASWNAYPANNMPDTWPIGLTSLINHYFRERMGLEVQFQGRGAAGKLTTLDDNKPLANATVNGYIPGVDFSQPLPTEVIQGVVPPNAAFAVIGYRLNQECDCQGTNDVLIGPLHFQETQGGSTDYTYFLPDGDVTYPGPPYNGVMVTNEWVGGARVNRVITTPTQQFGQNSAWIPVTPGAQYTFTIPASTMGSGPWYGHMFLIWFDQNQNGLPGSIFTVPDPGHRLMSSASTGVDGSFVLPILPRVGPGSAPVTVEFAGDATHRPVTWSPAQ